MLHTHVAGDVVDVTLRPLDINMDNAAAVPGGGSSKQQRLQQQSATDRDECAELSRQTSPNRHSRAAAVQRDCEQAALKMPHKPRINSKPGMVPLRSYPASREERLKQLAQPKTANRQKYEQVSAPKLCM